MYGGKQHEEAARELMKKAIEYLCPQTAIDVIAIDEFLWALDIECDFLDLCHVRQDDLDHLSEKITCSHSLEHCIFEEKKKRFEDADGYEDNKRYH